MKKLMLSVLAVCLLSTASFAGFGAAVKLGVGQNDPKSMDEYFHSPSFNGGEMDESGGIFGLEALYEMPLQAGDELNKIGFKLGVDFYGENELKEYGEPTITETTYAIPFTAYYKYDAGIKKVSFWGGAGLTFLKTKLEAGPDEESKSKTFFHLAGGGEYRFSELFALGLDLKYNISAKAEKDGLVYSDRSGLSGALAARFYF